MIQRGLDEALQDAVRQQALEVHYQPIISLRNGSITGFEALARWRHQGRDIPPSRFIHLAEQSGLIVTVDNLILRSACRQLRRWQLAGLVSPDHFISVNLSGRELQKGDFPRRIQDILSDNGLAGHNLHLEIASDAALGEKRVIATPLAELHALGVVCSVDDFGREATAAHSLARLPVDILKISHAATALNDEALCQLITQAHQQGMPVIAEGVENESFLRRLLQLQCEYAQGYYFSPPVDARQAGRMLAGDPRWQRVLH
ncbi:MAG: EAL domain-containing protein [Gammaproteobacteria bacterium]